MALGPAVPEEFRDLFGSVWLLLAFGCLAMLSVKLIRSITLAVRRNRGPET
jgi:hypothetical protein